MEKFKQQICLAAVTAAFVIQVFAAEPVTPPFQDPQEEWVLTYDNYSSVLWRDAGPKGMSRDVAIVRDNDNLYIKGIFQEYPDAWIKGTVHDKQLMFETGQILAVKGEEYVYFHCGELDHSAIDGNTTMIEAIDFYPSWQLFNKSQDRNEFTVGIASAYDKCSFWYSDKTDGCLNFWLRKKWLIEVGIGDPTVSGTGFPDVDYMIYMKLHRKGESGIYGIGSEQVDDTVAPMYDLQGRMVNPETARPGIYIQNGKKILIR